MKYVLVGTSLLFSSITMAADMSGWSDKTVCRLVEQHSKAEYIDEAKSRGLSCVIKGSGDQSIPASKASVNEATSRYRRNELACRMITNDWVKPELRQLDDFRIDKGNFGLADLYGDDSIEVIAGFSDEMFAGGEEFFQGNKERSREGSQYMFFSPDDDFVVPKNTKFLMARNIIPSDLNSDGIDDVVFVQHGPDYAPYVPHSNKVMLSSPNGYSVSTLSGPKALYHGGAVGDIDGDGDNDIIATPGENNLVVAYINNGKGRFSYKPIIGNKNNWQHNTRYYNAQLWDIDADGHLDLLLDGDEALAVIYWGKKNPSTHSLFEKVPSIIKGSKGFLMQDAVFGDFDNDGSQELIMLASLGKGSSTHFYRGWGIYLAAVAKREVMLDISVAHYPESRGYSWFPYFNACDLRNDGDIDLVIDFMGQMAATNFELIDKLVWENDGEGNFNLHTLNASMYFENRLDLDEFAESIGVSVRRYKAPQVYFDTNDKELYIRDGYIEARRWLERNSDRDLKLCKMAVKNGVWKSGIYDKVYVKNAKDEGLTIEYCAKLMNRH